MTDRSRVIETEAGYDSMAADYAARSASRSTESEAFLTRFAAALPAGAVVADLGCGPGVDLARFERAGHRSIGVDRSRELLGLAAGRLIRGDQAVLAVRSSSVDAIWSHAALLHLEAPDLAPALAEWERVLRPRGLVGFATSLGGDSGWESVPADPSRRPAPRDRARRWFVHHDESTVVNALLRRNWDIAELTVRSSHREWLQVLARTPDPRPSFGPVLDEIASLIGRGAPGSTPGPGPRLVAIDGRSASGKSTLATALAERLPSSALIRGDDFYRVMNDQVRFELGPAEGVAKDYDWERLRAQVLEPLRQNRPARFARYDWSTGGLGRAITVDPAPIVIAEGVYMSRPELRDLFDVTIFVEAAAPDRDRRQRDRSDPEAWVARWHRAEDHYVIRHDPAAAADVVVDGGVISRRRR